MSSIEKWIGARITGVRLSRKLTQAQLAEKVDVSVETISRMERGVSFPSLRSLENIAHALDTPLKTFFEFEEGPPKDHAFERELSKLTAFLRTMRRKDIALLYKILKVIYKESGPSPDRADGEQFI